VSRIQTIFGFYLFYDARKTELLKKLGSTLC